MLSFRFGQVCLEAFGLNLPPHCVTSDELEAELSELYKRLDVPLGTLERLSGVKTRYFWDDSVLPSEVGTVAAQRAIEASGIDRSHIRAVFNCSINRDFFEPATACLIHDRLKLPQDAIVTDITNACIGFSDGMMLLGNLIESGVVKAGVIVAGETVSRAIRLGIAKMVNTPGIDRDRFLKFLPTLTLGSGAVAAVLCHESLSKNNHRVMGSTFRAATQFSDLCVGDADYYSSQTDGFDPMMSTEASKLIASGAVVGAEAWNDTSRLLEWGADDVEHIFCHQVGKQLNDAWYAQVGLPRAKEFIIYPKYGNMVAAALPTAFAIGTEEKLINRNEKLLMMAFGSGLNARFTGVVW